VGEMPPGEKFEGPSRDDEDHAEKGKNVRSRLRPFTSRDDC
jgi:hypothetical protein